MTPAMGTVAPSKKEKYEVKITFMSLVVGMTKGLFR